MNELVTIIIPVYNVEEYLEQCIRSVISQSYKNIEVLLVDDGSTDSSGKICDEYKSIDDRICVIHKQNGGLSSARNAALNQMRGKYVLFLDSDDYIALDYIETHIELIIQNNADIIMGTLREFWGDLEDKLDYSNRNNIVEIYDTISALRMMLMDDKLHHAAAGPIYKACLFENIRFPEGILYEDFATTYYLVCNAKKIIFLDDNRYFYRMRPGSIMNSKVTYKDMVLIEIANKVTEDMIERYPQLKYAAIRKVVITYIKLYSRILYTGLDSFEDEQKVIRKVIMNKKNDLFMSKEVRNVDKIKVTVFCIGKIPFYLMYRISDFIQKFKKTYV